MVDLPTLRHLGLGFRVLGFGFWGLGMRAVPSFVAACPGLHDPNSESWQSMLTRVSVWLQGGAALTILTTAKGLLTPKLGSF